MLLQYDKGLPSASERTTYEIDFTIIKKYDSQSGQISLSNCCFGILGFEIHIRFLYIHMVFLGSMPSYRGLDWKDAYHDRGMDPSRDVFHTLADGRAFGECAVACETTVGGNPVQVGIV